MEPTPIQLAAAEVYTADFLVLRAKIEAGDLENARINEGERRIVVDLLDQLSTAMHDSRYCEKAREIFVEEATRYLLLLDANEPCS